MTNRVHPTAIIEDNATLGDGTSVWDNVHIRHGASLGESCIVGGKSCIAYDVQIGNRVKINSNAYICNAVTIEDGVMISAGVIFTNDKFPRAATPDLAELRGSEPDAHTLTTIVREGCTIGAGAIIGSDLELGRFSMIGMGSVVTKTVGDFCLVVGNPGHLRGFVCRCGEPTARFRDVAEIATGPLSCDACNRMYHYADGIVTEA